MQCIIYFFSDLNTKIFIRISLPIFCTISAACHDGCCCCWKRIPWAAESVLCVAWRPGLGCQQSWHVSNGLLPVAIYEGKFNVWPVWSISDVPPDQGWHGYILSARRKMSYVFTMVTQTNPQLPKSNLNFVFGQLPHVIYRYCNSMYCRVQYEGLFWRREEVQMIELKRGRFPI